MFCVSNIINPGRILLHWVSYVPMCFTCPSAFRALLVYLHLYCTCPHAHVPLLLTRLCGYVLLYLTNLHASVSFLFTCLGTFAFKCLRAYVPLCFTCLCFSTCFTCQLRLLSYVPLLKYVLSCEYDCWMENHDINQ